MKSLANSISTEHLVGQVVMKLSKQENREKVIVWVEGKDWRVYRKFFNPSMIIEHGAVGGGQVIEGHKKIKAMPPWQKSIVIKDADFKRLEGDEIEDDSNIFYTDGHDVEMMMIKQDKVRVGICTTFEYLDDYELFFTEVFDDLFYLSYFKWYDFHFKFNYSYTPMGKVRQKSACLKDLNWIENHLQDCSKALWNKSNHANPFIAINPDDINDFIAKHPNVDRYEITNGHDYYNRMCMHLGNKTKYSRNEECINDTIISYFDNEQFQNTSLYKALRLWCDTNVDILCK